MAPTLDQRVGRHGDPVRAAFGSSSRLGSDNDRPWRLAAAVARLKQERPDGYLLAQGGVRFARSLVQSGLIDEYRLVIHPVILSVGERLFTAPLTVEPREHWRSGRSSPSPGCWAI